MPILVSRWLLAATLLVAAFARQAPACAEQFVEFDAAAQAQPSAGRAPRIRGYLARPKGAGPFPAVVLLHSCLGLPANRRSIVQALAASGYVALYVDDFGTRGLKETCSVDFGDALPDAYGGLAFLSRLPFVDPARIAAVGFSQGADTALKIASARSVGPQAAGFKAAAAFYPPCANEADDKLRIPTLILVGSSDAVTPAADCERLAKAQGADSTVKLIVYPGAAHLFDDPAYVGGRRIMGMELRYDSAAAARSWAELRQFLAAELGR